MDLEAFLRCPSELVQEQRCLDFELPACRSWPRKKLARSRTGPTIARAGGKRDNGADFAVGVVHGSRDGRYL